MFIRIHGIEQRYNSKSLQWFPSNKWATELLKAMKAIPNDTHRRHAKKSSHQVRINLYAMETGDPSTYFWSPHSMPITSHLLTFHVKMDNRKIVCSKTEFSVTGNVNRWKKCSKQKCVCSSATLKYNKFSQQFLQAK